MEHEKYDRRCASDDAEHREQHPGADAPPASLEESSEGRNLARVELRFEVLGGVAVRAHIGWTTRQGWEFTPRGG